MLEYSERMGIEPDSGWSLLRPESEERADEVIDDGFGVSYSKRGDGELYDFIHTTLILLVNRDGYVERTYTNTEPNPDEIADDWEALVEKQRHSS